MEAHGPWALGAHGIDSDGESEVLRRSRREIPIHLDYREQDSSEEEISDDEHSEVEVIDDEEHSTPAQKRDAVSAGLSESSVSKKTKRIHLSNNINSRK